MRKTSRGFSLIELLIVVAIILIIAAIAIPNLLRSRIAANQASAVGSLRTLVTSEVTYASTYNTGYTVKLDQLGPNAGGSAPANATNAGLVDSVLAGCESATACVTGTTAAPTLGGTGNAEPTLTDASGTAMATLSYSSKSGYVFQYGSAAADSSGHINAFMISATPQVLGTTGTDYYLTDESGVIRIDTASTINYASTPLAG